MAASDHDGIGTHAGEKARGQIPDFLPSAAVAVPDGDWESVVRDSHAVIEEAKVAGVYVFGGGIDDNVPPVLVSADGTVAQGGYPWAPALNGGLTVF